MLQSISSVVWKFYLYPHFANQIFSHHTLFPGHVRAIDLSLAKRNISKKKSLLLLFFL